MVDKAAITNRALQVVGTRTTVTAAELVAESSNEAIQTNLAYVPLRNQLLRMAPWNCAFNTQSLVYITSVPGTPENTSTATDLWAKGQPAPPWAYEYQYPVDCLLACWITPQTATGFAGGIPITTAVTGGSPSFWQGPPVRYKVQTDKFLMVSAAAVVAGGTGYAVGDYITVALQTTSSTITNKIGQFFANAPQGAAVVLQVATLAGSAVATVNVVGQIYQRSPALGGSYFYANTTTATQDTTTGSGTGATFTLTFGSDPIDQRVILTNQEFAILNYIKVVEDENLFDDLFQEAFVRILGAKLCTPLAGDKALAANAIAEANAIIMQARRQDGNEGLTVNDVTPDWIRARGVNYTEDYSGPYNTGYDWGSLWPGFN